MIFAAVQQNSVGIGAISDIKAGSGGLKSGAYDPKRASGCDGGCMSGFMQPPKHGIVPLPKVQT
jgi:hypothetical protein